MTKKRKRQNPSMVPLSEFPVVFMSFDEPWADEVWADLQKIRPDAKRVHGVKGLNACHVAASQEAGTPWFLTVDADTTLSPEVASVKIPEAYLNPAFRLDWQSRNAVNGIVSGNGSLKLWSRELARDMRSHEAAPKDKVSLDADIGSIKSGRSRLILMPGCYSETDPARAPFHAFRAGFREASFLSWHLRRQEMSGSTGSDELRQILTIWCTLGTHTPHGDWLLYGARLGLWAERTWKKWDIRLTHDYDWFQRFWSETVLNRIGQGGGYCPLSRTRWDADRLRDEVAAFGPLLETVTDFPLADLDPEASRTMVEAQLFPATRALESIDSLGRAFQKGRGVPADIDLAEGLYREAAMLLHPSALTNLARLHQLELVAKPDEKLAETLFRRAMALGCAFAPYQLTMLLREAGQDVAEEDLLRLVDLSAERGFAQPEEPA